jgi:FixJ family two-component response regulator
LREIGATTPVIFISGYNDVPVTVRAMRSGAIDFLSKPVSDEALLNAIELAFTEEARLRAERDEVEELRRKYDLLTPREQDVFRLVLAGRLNKQIARELGISEKTVKVHRGRVMAKMGARRVAHLVQFAARLGYLATSTAAAQPQPSRPVVESAPVWRRKEELGLGLRLPPISTGT